MTSGIKMNFNLASSSTVGRQAAVEQQKTLLTYLPQIYERTGNVVCGVSLALTQVKRDRNHEQV